MRIFCPINTPEISELIERFNLKYPDQKIGSNWGYNLVGLYQAKHNTENMPSVGHLYSLLNENKEEVMTAIPIYNNGQLSVLPQPKLGSVTEVTENINEHLSKLKGFELHSGGANGADTIWGEIGKKFGVKVHHYYDTEKTPQGNEQISVEDRLDGQKKTALAAKELYDFEGDEIFNKKVVRDWAQVKYADAVFAVGGFLKKGERLDDNKVSKKDIETPKGRIAASKLLNKDKLIDVTNTVDGGLQIAVKGDNATGFIKFSKSKNRWEVVVENEGDRIFLTPEQQQKLINRHIPRDLQEYFLSGQYKVDDAELNKKAGESSKSADERAREILKGHIGSDQVLRDKWGIYFTNEWTGESNYIERTAKIPQPKGGTRYAVQMAIMEGKPVYFYDQNRKKWYQNTDGTWKELSEVPTLTKNFAGVGTTHLNEAGRKAIEDVYSKSTGVGDVNSVETKVVKQVKNEPKITSISKDGKISLYEIPGEGNQDQMNFFMDFISGRIPNSRSEIQAATLKAFFEGPEGLDLGIKDEKALRDFINNRKNAYSVALWIAQSHIEHNDVANWNNSYQLSPNNIAMEVRALSEALRKLKMLKKLRKSEQQELSVPISGRNHIEIKQNSYSELAKDLSPSEREMRVERLSWLFTATVTNIKNEFIDEIQSRIEELSEQNVNTSTARELRDLRRDLEALEGEDGDIKAINRAGIGREDKNGVAAIKERILKEYEEYVNMSDEEAVAHEKRKNKYVQITLKRGAIDYESEVLEYVRRKKDAYQKVIKHFDILFMESFADIEYRTGIVLSNHTARRSSEEEIDEDGNTKDDQDSEIGESYKDGWLTKARKVDPTRTLVKEIKVLLSNIPLKKGNKFLLTDLGEKRYMDGNKAFTILLTETAQLINDEQFGSQENPLLFLERLSKKYGWVNTIIKNLKNEDGSIDNITLTKLFTALRQQGIYYSQVRDQYHSTVNTMSGRDGLMQSLRNNIELGKRLNSLSIYEIDGTFNNKNGEKLKEKLSSVKDILSDMEGSTEREQKEAVESLSNILMAIGLNIEADDIYPQLSDGEFISSLLNDVFPEINVILSGKEDMSNGIVDVYKFRYYSIIDKVGVIKEDTALKTSFSNRGVQKNSYGAINKVHKIVRSLSQDAFNLKMKGPNYKNLFEKTLEEQYLSDRFFKNVNGDIMHYWLRTLKESKEFRQKIHEMTLDSIDGIPYEDWEAKDIYHAFAVYYLNHNESSKNLQHSYAYYCMPIFSDSEAAIFIRAPKFTGDSFREDVRRELANVVKQELFRISRVEQRAELIKEGKIEAIVNYDIYYNEKGEVVKRGGAEFKFFPQLNNTITIVDKNGNSVEVDFIKEYKNLVKKGKTKEANDLIDRCLDSIMREGFETFARDLDVESREAFKLEDAKMDANTLMEEFYYNSVLANTQIIQLTTVDLAFYKNAIDFQKRFKEVYAAGKRLNTNSPKGKKTRRALYLKDQIHPSNTLSGIHKALASNPNLDKNARDYILTKFKKINATDAQALLTPTSYSEMLDMLGGWTEEMDIALEHFRQSAETGVPVWTAQDFSVIWQTLKPFMYTIKDTYNGIEGDENMRSPLQHKNSETLMAFIFNLVSGSSNGYTGASNNVTQKALTRFMERENIDVAMFESAVKVGGHSFVDLTHNEKRFQEDLKDGIKVGSETIRTPEFRNFLIEVADLLSKEKITQEQYREAIHRYDFQTEEEVMETLEDFYMDEEGVFDEKRIDSFDYEDVMIAQENPEHLLDTEASFGSQFANIILSDITGTLNIRGSNTPIQDVRSLYDDLRLENVLDGYESVKKVFGSMESLRESLINAINNNPSYSRDLINGLEIVHDAYNPYTRETQQAFMLPFNTPSVSNQLTQLALSLFRTKVTKQHIRGGNAVLVSDFGLTDQLEVVTDKDGNLVEIQCFLPAFTKEFFAPFMKEDGTLSIDDVPEELRKIIGYRIPTEGKYSMAPLKIMGFLPQQNGSIIMLSSDITSLAGSDFDVDKLFLMIPNFKKVVKTKRKAFKDFIAKNYPNIDAWSKGKKTGANENYYSNRIDSFLDQKENGIKFEEGSVEKLLDDIFELNKEEFTEISIEKIAYDLNKPASEQTKEARDNMIMEIAWAALTSKEGSRAVLTPGNFDNVADGANINKISGNKELLDKFIEKHKIKGKTPSEIARKAAKLILELSDKERAKFVSENERDRWSCSPTTFVDFHSENTIGGKMIGVFANSTTHQAKKQNKGLKVTGDYQIELFDIKEQRLDRITSSKGKLISSTMAEYSAASVDDAKEHNLKPLNLNLKTANIALYLGRLGYSPQEIGILMANPSFMNAPNWAPKRASEANYISTEDFLTDTILITRTGKSLFSKKEMNDVQLLHYKIKKGSEALSEDINISRADSPKGGIDNTVGGYAAQIIRGTNYTALTGGVLEGGDYRVRAISKDMSRNQLRDVLKNSASPQLAAFRALGIELASELFGDYHIGVSPEFMEIAEDIADYLPNCKISKELGNRLFKHYITYSLSKTKLFGDEEKITMEEKRNYYTRVFPKKLDKWRKQNKELVEANSFLRNLNYDKKGNRITIASPKSFSNKTVADIKRAAVDLLLDPSTQDIAGDILSYCYYTNGLWFGPDSPSFYIMTTPFLINFPELMSALRFMKDNLDRDNSRFLDQFYTNNAGMIPPARINSRNVTYRNGMVEVERKKIENNLGHSAEFLLVKNPMGQNTLYRKVTDDSSKGVTTYSVVRTSFEYPTFNANSESITVSQNEELFIDPTITQEVSSDTDVDTSDNSIQNTGNPKSIEALINGLGSVEELEPGVMSSSLFEDVDAGIEEAERLEPGVQAAFKEAFAKREAELDAEGSRAESTNIEETRSNIEDKYNPDDSQDQLDDPLCLPKN